MGIRGIIMDIEVDLRLDNIISVAIDDLEFIDMIIDYVSECHITKLDRIKRIVDQELRARACTVPEPD